MDIEHKLLKNNNTAFMLQSVLCIVAIAALLYWNSLLRKDINEIKYEASRNYLVKIVLHNNSGKDVQFISRSLNYYAYPNVEQIDKGEEHTLKNKDWYQFGLTNANDTEWQVEYRISKEKEKHKYTADISDFASVKGHRYELHAYLQADGTIKEERYILDSGRFYKLAQQPVY